MNKILKIIDCTFRDGGYYNQWDFDPKTTQRYLHSINAAGIDYIEIGFRAFSSDANYAGPFAYSPEWYLKHFELPRVSKIGVMANAKDLIALKSPDSKRMDSLFPEAKKSAVKLVRIASHFREVNEVSRYVTKLKNLGYEVGFNLMQSAGKTAEELQAVSKQIASWEAVDVLYFADSLGNMTPNDVKSTVSALKSGWNGELGIHAHDNKGLALINTLTAIDAGVNWVDSTILGMGRGAGNTRTEHLLIELESRVEFRDRFKSSELYSIVLQDFEELRSKYKWGSNLLYYIAAESDIHPTYIQEMMAQCASSPQKLLNGIEVLKQMPSKSYSQENLQTALNGSREGFEGTSSASAELGGRDVLILASGKHAVSHGRAIQTFIAHLKPYTICLNFEVPIADQLIDTFAACNTSRIVVSWDKITKLRKPIILPKSALPSKLINSVGPKGIIDFGIKISPGLLAAHDSSAELPASLVAPYAMAFAAAGGAKNIFLAGFDGFDLSDPRHGEMVRVVELFKENFPNIKLIAITPTTYPVSMASVYEYTEFA